MSDDKELIARLRDAPADGLGTENLCLEAADRIKQLVATNEALTKERDEAWKRAAHAEKMWGEAETKLAKTAKVALAYEDWVTDAYDLLEERREEFDPESPSDKAIMDLMDKAEAGIARATLAEIKGESHD